jgi:hypothetical protein
LRESGDVGAFGGGDLPPRVGGRLIDEGAQFLPLALMCRRAAIASSREVVAVALAYWAKYLPTAGRSAGRGCMGSKPGRGKGWASCRATAWAQIALALAMEPVSTGR